MLWLWLAAGRELRGEAEPSLGVDAIALTPSKEYLFTAGQGSVMMWKTGGANTKPAKVFEHAVAGAAPSSVSTMLITGGVLFTAGYDGRIIGWAAGEVPTCKRLCSVSLGDQVATKLAADADALYVGTIAGVVLKIPVAQCAEGKLQPSASFGVVGTVWQLMYPGDGDLIYVAATDGGFKAVPTAIAEPGGKGFQAWSGEVKPGQDAAAAGNIVQSLTAAGSTRAIYSATADGIEAWDTKQGRVLGKWDDPVLGAVRALAIAKNGSTLFSGGDKFANRYDVFTVYDSETAQSQGRVGSLSAELRTPQMKFPARVRALAVDEEKYNRLYVAGDQPEVEAYDLWSGENARAPFVHFSTFYPAGAEDATADAAPSAHVEVGPRGEIRHVT